MKDILRFGLFILISFESYAQEIIRGEVTDARSNEPIYGVLVKVNGAGKARTDFEGSFSFKLSPGSYTISFSNDLEGYIEQEISLDVEKGAGVIPLSVTLGKDDKVIQLEGAIVKRVRTGGTVTTNEAADTSRINEPGPVDIMPKSTITNSGARSGADIVQMVPAASVEGGKNVYIRGLGDRYTKTILNGMDIPGLDPDRNSVQLDVFPAILIDNVTVYKSFTPNLTADFTGGLVNIQTIDFPAKKTFYVKSSLGYNNNATFNSDFVTYDGGGLDFLGFDDGSRALPISPTATISHPAEGEESLERITRSFSSTMSTTRASAFMNQNHAIAYGNQLNKTLKKDSSVVSYGINAVLNYRTSNNYYSNVEYNEYLRPDEFEERELFKDRTSLGEMGIKDVMWTALLGQSVKFKKNKISFVVFRTQNGTSTAANLTETNFDSNQAILVKQGLQYTQRSVTNANLSGLHYLDSASNWKLEWKLSPTLSQISDPDIRSTALEVSDIPGPNGEIQYRWDESVGAEVRRIFRSLEEYNVSGRVDMEYKFVQWDSLPSKLSFGLLNTYKNRSFDVNEYVFRLTGTSKFVPNDPDWFFESQNIWTPESDSGTYATGQQEKANIYEANQMISAAYVMNELPLGSGITATYGARVERNENKYTGQSNNAETDPNAPRYENETVLEALNVLPSLNLVYRKAKDADSIRRFRRATNLRLAYTQTVARPSFREISISQIYDPIQNRRYLGNIDLKQTLIHNADLRWERFFGRTELVSASAFYKRFINPIEVVANVAAPNEFKPVNAGVADIYGAECEIRKSIGFTDSTKQHLRLEVGANFAYILSLIDMDKIETVIGDSTTTEWEIRKANARVGETVSQFRPMYGQSPYIINAFVTFKNDSLRMMCNLTYNVQGKRLAVIGVGSLPDVYEQPFHSLNLKISKGFGKIHKGEDSPRWQGSFRATNLLQLIDTDKTFTVRQKHYEAYQAESQYFEYLNQGMTFSASVSYTIR